MCAHCTASVVAVKTNSGVALLPALGQMKAVDGLLARHTVFVVEPFLLLFYSLSFFILCQLCFRFRFVNKT